MIYDFIFFRTLIDRHRALSTNFEKSCKVRKIFSVCYFYRYIVHAQSQIVFKHMHVDITKSSNESCLIFILVHLVVMYGTKCVH